jgi:hypothetical protein
MKMSISSKEALDLETNYIDKHGLVTTLECIADICMEKSNHILHNYGSDTLAKGWEKASKVIEKVASKIDDYLSDWPKGRGR